MRETFYHWLAAALLFTMFFGAAIARAAAGHLVVFDLVTYGLIGIGATMGAIDHYRRK